LREDTAPYSDRNVRLALSAAIDREAISEELYGGYSTILNFPFPAAWPESLFTPLDEMAPDTQRAYTYDPEWAMELLADAGYPDGFKTEMLMESTSIFVDVMSLVADNWADIGVDCELQPTDAGTVRGYISGLTHPHMLAWEDSSATPASAMTGYVERGFTNIIIMRDPYVEAGFDAALAEPDSVAQNAIWKDLFEYVTNDNGYIILPAENFITMWHPWLKNFEGESRSKYNNSSWALQFAWIDQALKEEMGY
jgi:ABC-type transport system substrate-binding protein